MLRAVAHFPAKTWPEREARDGVTLDYDGRHRRRLRLTSDRGVPVLLDLERAVAMAHGDGLRTDGGAWLRVQAAPESLVQVRCPDPLTLVRLAWHIGNRHVPAQIGKDAILIRPDPVIEAMLRDNGATLAPLTAPFQPMGGAYHSHQGSGAHGATGRSDTHDHSHDHGHPHDHSYGDHRRGH